MITGEQQKSNRKHQLSVLELINKCFFNQKLSFRNNSSPSWMFSSFCKFDLLSELNWPFSFGTWWCSSILRFSLVCFHHEPKAMGIYRPCSNHDQATFGSVWLSSRMREKRCSCWLQRRKKFENSIDDYRKACNGHETNLVCWQVSCSCSTFSSRQQSCMGCRWLWLHRNAFHHPIRKLWSLALVCISVCKPFDWAKIENSVNFINLPIEILKTSWVWSLVAADASTTTTCVFFPQNIQVQKTAAFANDTHLTVPEKRLSLLGS